MTISKEFLNKYLLGSVLNGACFRLFGHAKRFKTRQILNMVKSNMFFFTSNDKESTTTYK